MQHRPVAELVRQLRCLAPLGGGQPFPRLPPHLRSYGDPSETWMYWYVRGVQRATGLPSATIDAAYVGQCRRYLENLVAEQIDFHERNALRFANVDHRLHHVGIGLFVLTGLACLVHGLPHLPEFGLLHGLHEHVAGPPLTFLGAVLPALGAAFAAIRNQGEFRRVTKRSRAMAARLRRVAQRLDEL